MALELAGSAEDELLRCRLLAQLSPYVERQQQEQIAELVLAISGDVGWRLVEEVAPLVAEDRIAAQLAVARTTDVPHPRVWVLLAFVPRLDAPHRGAAHR